METLNIAIEKNDDTNKPASQLKIYIPNDIFLIVSAIIFSGLVSYAFNMGKVLTFQEQLAIVNKPNFPHVLCMLVGFFAVFDLLRGIINIAIDGKELTSKFASIWTPIRFTILCGFFMPFEQNGIMTSTVVETIKYIIKYISN